MRPQKSTYPVYYENYIPLVKEDDLITALNQNWKEIKEFISQIPKQKENFSYAPGKWTIKQVVNHLIDTERVFTYRALRFARKDPQQPLPFEEDNYAAAAEVQERTLADIMDEFEAVRKSTLLLYKSFSNTTLLLSGKTAGGETTVLAIGYTTCGHATHHLRVISERYLKN
jgi:hypothetical protein